MTSLEDLHCLKQQASAHMLVGFAMPICQVYMCSAKTFMKHTKYTCLLYQMFICTRVLRERGSNQCSREDHLFHESE